MFYAKILLLQLYYRQFSRHHIFGEFFVICLRMVKSIVNDTEKGEKDCRLFVGNKKQQNNTPIKWNIAF